MHLFWETQLLCKSKLDHTKKNTPETIGLANLGPKVNNLVPKSMHSGYGIPKSIHQNISKPKVKQIKSSKNVFITKSLPIIICSVSKCICSKVS